VRKLGIALAIALALVSVSVAFAQPPTGSRGTMASEAPPANEPGIEDAVQTAPTLEKRLIRLLVAVCVVVLLLSALLLFFENRFVFHPTHKPAVDWDLPGTGIEECTFRSRDGTRLHGWWHPGAGGQAEGETPVLLWCHGNAGNITHRADDALEFARHGLAFLLFDYRGYGKSEGKPSEHGLNLDAEAAYAYLTEQRGIRPGRIICFGRSLGAAVALHAALRGKPAGVIMEAAFASMPSVAMRKIPFPPLGLFMRNQFDCLGMVGYLRVPLLMVHGSDDRLVPIRHGRRVYEAAPGPKEFYTIEGAGHNETSAVGGQPYFEAIARFCFQCVRSRGE